MGYRQTRLLEGNTLKENGKSTYKTVTRKKSTYKREAVGKEYMS
jgi:hypothetical protein